MNEKFKEYFDFMIVQTIRKKSTMLAIERLKSNKKYDQSFLGWIIGLIALISISIAFSIWWLFIPTAVIYFIYDYTRKFKYVRKQLPIIMDDIITDTLFHTSQDIKDIEEDLVVKVANNIYNQEDIDKKESELSMLKQSQTVLKEILIEVKLEL